jgi:hypothetical protein
MVGRFDENLVPSADPSGREEATDLLGGGSPRFPFGGVLNQSVWGDPFGRRDGGVAVRDDAYQPIVPPLANVLGRRGRSVQDQHRVGGRRFVPSAEGAICGCQLRSDREFEVARAVVPVVREEGPSTADDVHAGVGLVIGGDLIADRFFG